MKDPHDQKTVDGFAELVTLVENAPSLKKRGRKPAGEKALTPAEKQKAYRDRKRERVEALKQGKPVDSAVIDLNTRFPDALRSKG